MEAVQYVSSTGYWSSPASSDFFRWFLLLEIRCGFLLLLYIDYFYTKKSSELISHAMCISVFLDRTLFVQMNVI